MSLAVLLGLSVINIFGWAVGGWSGMREAAYVYDFCPCPDVETSAEVTASFSYRGRDDYRINIDWNLNGSYDNIDAILDINKCPTRALVDCESYLRFKVSDICTSVHNELNYTRIFGSVQPPIESCPLSGQHTMSDFPIIEEVPQVKKVLGFGLIPDNRILSCDFSLVADGEVLLCLRFVGSFRLVKNKPSAKPPHHR